MKYILDITDSTQVTFEQLRAPFESDDAFLCRLIAAYTQSQRKESPIDLSLAKDKRSSRPHTNQTINIMQQNRAFTWVPTVYNFESIITKYIAFRKKTVDDATINFKDAFIKFLQDEEHYTGNTAQSYCFPLTEREFDLFDRSLDELEVVAKGKREGLEAAFKHRTLSTHERIYVSLVDVFLVGKLWDRTPNERIDVLKQAGFAHANGSATAIVSVGKNVGAFFGLLNAKTYQPTHYFDDFFGSSYADLEEILNAVT